MKSEQAIRERLTRHVQHVTEQHSTPNSPEYARQNGMMEALEWVLEDSDE